MARYYRRRYRTIVRAPKKKWASNITRFVANTAGTDTLQYLFKSLVTNSTELASPTPVIVKTGNFKVQGDVRFQANSGTTVAISLYVIFIPQGVIIDNAVTASTIVVNHPEWIMGWKFISANTSDSLSSVQSDTFSFSSRLKRNLNSGDAVAIIGLAETSGVITSCTLNCMAQYWTCAN